MKTARPARDLFPEIKRIEGLQHALPEIVRLRELATVVHHGLSFPVYGLTIGSEDKTRPTFGLFAGVHGLERIGVHVALAFLESFVGRLQWDKDARRTLKKIRIVSIPIVNPAGMLFYQRCNPRGVDLMRNAPVEAESRPPWLLGGHRLTPLLPWYRGRRDFEIESRALVDFVEAETFDSRAVMTLDVHSGFGLRDRLWYPYAKTRRPISRIESVLAWIALLERTYPHHVYLVEPQSASYTTHGDLWDYIYDRFSEFDPNTRRLFVPWTLEIGSWRWIKKNPRQILRKEGVFNPSKPHRYSRTMRRHLLLLDFFVRALRNHKSWAVGGGVR